MRLPAIHQWVSDFDSKPKTSELDICKRIYRSLTNFIEKTTYTTAFKRLAMAGLITALLPEHSRSSTDRLLIAQEKEAQKYTITSAKDMKAIKIAAQAQIDAEFSMAEGIGMVSVWWIVKRRITVTSN